MFGSGIASALVGGLIVLVSLLVATLRWPAAPLLLVPVGIVILIVIAVVAPFAAGVAGGLASGRSVAALGSVAGFLIGGGMAFALSGWSTGGGYTPGGIAAVVAGFVVVTLVGHFVAVAMRRPLEETT